MNSINTEYLVNKYHLNKYTLAFSEEIESEYKSWKFASYIRLIRISLIIQLELFVMGSFYE